jgi:hypothetical protein
MKKREMNVGNIFGFDSQLRNKVPFHYNKLDDCWGSKLDNLEILKDEIRFSFFDNGDQYRVVLKPQNDSGDYKGRILANGDEAGNAYFTVYENPKSTLLWGQWIEENYSWYTLIEIIWKPIK